MNSKEGTSPCLLFSCKKFFKKISQIRKQGSANRDETFFILYGKIIVTLCNFAYNVIEGAVCKH